MTVNDSVESIPDLGNNEDEIWNVFMNSPIGIYIIADGKFLFTNPKFREISGYTKKDLSAISPVDLVLCKDRKKVRENAVRMLKGLISEPYRFRVTDKTGDIHWIMESVASVQYKGRRAVLGNFMDTTEMKHMEEVLKESENKYRLLFELAREGIALVDYEDGSIIDSNIEFIRQTKFHPDTLKEKKIWEIQPPEFQKEARETFFRFRETSGGIISWKLCQSGKKNVIPVEIVAQRIMIKNHDTIMCMVRDISERETMMRALRLASEEWRKCFDAIGDAVLLINPNFIIDRTNTATARLLKMDVHEIVGKHCYKLFHGTDSPPAYCPFVQAKAGGIYCEEEKKEAHLNRILKFTSSPIKNDTGQVSHTVEIISDVTNRRRSEQESVRLSRDLAASYKGITEALSDLVESRDPYTAGHSRHVAKLAILAGKELGLGKDDLQGLRICAILHDIGKAIIPAGILNKPGKLSEHEWGLIKTHPQTAYDTLNHIPFPWPVADIVYQHHERLDGSGYPQGLKEDEIHPWAQIISVADTVDAMTSHRPYRPSMPRNNALNELVEKRGILYSKSVVDAIIQAIRLDDKRILVIDNDVAVLNSIVTELKADGFEALGHTESIAGLKAFEIKPFPLVITSLKLPWLDGFEVTAKIKNIHPETEVIIITKYGGKKEALEALRSGASDFLEKPLDQEI
ncbi:PAS domain S-box protein, partial [Desulfobacterales bacterium HSG16]|nr:PAS domain S-box protein [Desulfobacterales bacterium HSG16]